MKHFKKLLFIILTFFHQSYSNDQRLETILNTLKKSLTALIKNLTQKKLSISNVEKIFENIKEQKETKQLIKEINEKLKINEIKQKDYKEYLEQPNLPEANKTKAEGMLQHTKKLYSQDQKAFKELQKRYDNLEKNLTISHIASYKQLNNYAFFIETTFKKINTILYEIHGQVQSAQLQQIKIIPRSLPIYSFNKLTRTLVEKLTFILNELNKLNPNLDCNLIVLLLEDIKIQFHKGLGKLSLDYDQLKNDLSNISFESENNFISTIIENRIEEIKNVEFKDITAIIQKIKETC